MRGDQDAVGVLQMQALGRLQRLALQELRRQHAQRGLVGSAQAARCGTALQRVSPERFVDRMPGDGAPYAPFSDLVEHAHVLEAKSAGTIPGIRLAAGRG